MEEKTVLDFVEDAMEKALKNKEQAQDPESARAWAVVRTDLEKVRAYIMTYLE